jgi:hypothetical protein
MSEPPKPQPAGQPPVPSIDSPFMSLISACLFLFIGFGVAWVRNTGHPIQDVSMLVFVWGARIVGIGLLLVAGLSYFGLGIASVLDLVLAGLAAVGCIVVGVTWLAFGDHFGGGLLVLFGLVNGSAARAAWFRWRQYRAAPAMNDEQ